MNPPENQDLPDGRDRQEQQELPGDGDAADDLKALWALDRPPEPTTVEDLRAEVQRRRRRMVAIVAGEVVLTLGLVALTVGLLAAEGPLSPGVGTLLGLLWLTWLVATGFATWNRWGVWQASGETALSYLALSEERARRRRRVATFVLGLVAVQFIVLLVLGEVRSLGLAIVALYVGWGVWYRWRAGKELAAIRRIASEFRDGSTPA